MEFRPIRPDIVKYEMRVVSGEDPFAERQKTPGAFGRFLSGIGRLFGAVAAPMSLIFPPAAIGAAGMYGIGQIGDQMQYRTYMRMMQQQQAPQYISFPGLEGGPGGPGGITPVKGRGHEGPLGPRPFTGPNGALRPAAGPGISAANQTVMDVLFARNDMMMESAQAITRPKA